MALKGKRTPALKSGSTLLFSTICLCALSLSAQDKPAEKPISKVPELSELSKLKAENLKLRTNNAQCQIDLLDRESRLASVTLTGQQSKLEVEFMKELGCNSTTQKFNWQTLACDAKTPLPVVK